jgi:ligand-binding sensor domain-containing protein
MKAAPKGRNQDTPRTGSPLKKYLLLAALVALLLGLGLGGVKISASGPLALTATATSTKTATRLTGTPTLTPTSTISRTTTPRWEVFTNANCTRDSVIVGDTLWAGTCGGVVGWDIPTGTYQKYTTAHGLLHNVINHIAADEVGQVWVSYGMGQNPAQLQGIGHFDGEEWANITEMGLNQPIKQVNDLVIDRSGRVWLAYQSSSTPLAMFDGQMWTTFGQADGIPSFPAKALLAGHDGRVWAIVGPAVASYDGTTWQTYAAEETGLDGTANAISQDGLGRIWFSSATGFSRFDGDTWASFPPFDTNKVYRIAADDKGGLWVPTEPGVLRRFDGHTWQSYTVEDGLPSTGVSSLAVDEAGRLWVATYRTFATVLDGQSAMALATDDLLPGNAISAIDFSPGGDLWLIADGWITQISTTSDGERRATVHSKLGQQARNAKRAVLDHDSQGRTWTITNFGVVFYDGQKWLGYREINGVVYTINNLLVDSEDRVWAKISGNGFDLAVLDEDKWTVYDAPLGWATWRVGDMVEGPKGNIWLANLSEGLSRFDGQGWSFRPYEEISPNLKDVDQITFDGQGQLWLARGYDFAPGGVWVDDGATVKEYGLRDGLLEEGITALTSDAAGRIWVGYDSFTADHVYAASYFDGDTWYTYTLPHGLAGMNVREIAIDAQGRVYFATFNGLSRFDPNLPRPAHEPAPLQLKAQPYPKTLLVGPGTPPRLYALWTDGFETRIITSDDSGVTWGAFPGAAPPCIHNLNLDYAAQDALYASTCEGLYGWDGLKWRQISTQHMEMVAVVHGQPNRIWAARRVGQPQEIPVLFSQDGGQAWQPASRYLEHTQGVQQIGLHPQDPNVLFATVWPTGEGSYLRRGTGDGQWETLPTPLDNAAIEPYFIIDDPTMYLVTAAPNSQLWRSNNFDDLAADTTWELVHDFAERTQVTLLAAGPRDTLYANFFDDTLAPIPQLHRSQDGGQRWEPVTIDFVLE